MITETIAGLLQGTVKPILDKFIPDAKDRLEAENLLLHSVMSGDLGQIGVNTKEAESPALFVSGWRPAIGWTCGLAYAYTFVLQPFGTFLLMALGHPIDAASLPRLETSELSMVLFGMLGLGTMRSYEKVNGVAK